MNDMTRAELLEQLTAFERRINERFDLLERLVALGFDDTSDQIKMGIERIAHSREPATSRDLPGRGSGQRVPPPAHPTA